MCALCTVAQGNPANGGFEIHEPNYPEIPQDWYFEDITNGGEFYNINDIKLHALLNNPSNSNVWLDSALEKELFVVLSTGYPYDKREDPNYYSSIEQLIALEPGDTIYGAYFFGTTDWKPYNDTAFGKLIDPTLQLISSPELWLNTDDDGNFTYLSSIPSNDVIHPDVGIELFRTDVGSYVATEGWQPFEYRYEGPDSVIFRLFFQVRDSRDKLWSSYLAFDHIRICRAGNSDADFNNDCSVDFLDFSILSQAWLADCDDPNTLADPNIPCGLLIEDPNTPNKIIDTDYLLPVTEHWLEWFGYP